MLAQVTRGLDLTLRWLAIAALSALTLCVLLGVISRALNNPFDWTEELSRYLMVWVAILGWVLASRSRAHIRIRFFQDMLPPRAWAVAEIVLQLAVVLFGLLVAWFAIDLVQRNSDIDAVTLPLTQMWFYIPLLAGGLIAALQAVAEIAGVARDRQNAKALSVPVLANAEPAGRDA